MSLKHIFMLGIICCFSCIHAGQPVHVLSKPDKKVGAVARGLSWFVRKMPNAVSSGIASTGFGYVLPKLCGSTDEQIRTPSEQVAGQGRFDVRLEGALSYARAVQQELEKNKSQKGRPKRVLSVVCRGYGVDVMRKATIHLLSEQNMPSIPGPLIVRYFAAALGNSMLHACVDDFFVRPCTRFGTYLKKKGFKRLVQKEGMMPACRLLLDEYRGEKAIERLCDSFYAQEHHFVQSPIMLRAD